VVGEGWHRAAGQPHAEVEALASAGQRARGATVYVTLEPCCHHGRTPPCTEALIEAGVARVHYALSDPDPKVAGRGAAVLRQAGIEVREGPCEAEAAELNEGYLKHRRTGRPFVTLKLAVSWDGKVATRTGASKYLTGDKARRYVHRLRDEADAVMVGSGTVLADDPALTTRRRRGRDALRVIVDSRARTPVEAQVVSAESPAGCVIAVAASADTQKVNRLAGAGAEVWRCGVLGGRADLEELLTRLGRRGILSVLCEGGPTLAAGLIERGLVDKFVLLVAPLVIGGAEAPTVAGGQGVAELGDALRLRFTKVRRLGPDVLLEAYPCSPD